MDYEEKYKTSLEKAKGFYALCNRCGAKDTANFLEDAFPELIESENERIRKRLIDLVCETYANTSYITWDEHEDMLAWLKKQDEKKPAWSEEDEKTLNEIFLVAARASLRKSTLFGKSYDYIKWQNFLKSLKDRVQPQLKQEWSEEDEHRAKDTIYFLDTAKKHYASTVELDACIEWIKSLKKRIGG